MKKCIVIVDIDGTIANVNHRRPLVENLDPEKQDWKSFLHEWNLIKDTPVEEIVTLVRTLHEAGYLIYLATGRPDCLEYVTKLWLSDHEVPYDRLFMRKTKDSRKDSIVKEEFLQLIPKENILFVIDDRNSVVEMWRKNGLKVLQCAEGDF